MIGIIAAESKEMNEIKKLMKNIEEKDLLNLQFFTGKIEEAECVLVECGEGKVNAARTTQIMIDNFKIDKLVNVGSAGAINEDLNVKDVVIADKLVQYDFDISGLGYEKGEICNIGKYIYCDKTLVEECQEAIENIENTKSIKDIKNTNNNENKENAENIKKIENIENDSYKVVIGTIATADSFCDKPEIAKMVRKEFNAECVEMEGAAVAQVCYLDKIPFLVIRGISDTPNGNNKIDFRKYLEIASKQSAKILQNLIKIDQKN